MRVEGDVRGAGGVVKGGRYDEGWKVMLGVEGVRGGRFCGGRECLRTPTLGKKSDAPPDPQMTHS